MDNQPIVRDSHFQKLWIGSQGLRTGWAILLFLMIDAAVLIVIGHVAYLLHRPMVFHREMTASELIVFELSLLFAALVATKVLSLIDKRSWLDYGLGAPHRLVLLGRGIFWGVAMMSAMMAILTLSHGMKIEYSGESVLSLIKSGLLWAIAFALVALAEETTCRGYAFFRLAAGANAILAAIIMSLFFGAAHLSNHGETVTGIAQVAMFGLVCCLAVWRTGSLWWVYGMHAAWDWSESFLFGAADSGLVIPSHVFTSHSIGPAWLSGGSVGPEGSLLVFPVLALLAFVIMRTLPRSKHRLV
jgi:uncharacterized protein